jgi:hypothetical protein
MDHPPARAIALAIALAVSSAPALAHAQAAPQPSDQSFEGDPEAEKPIRSQPPPPQPELTPQDVQSFAEATLEATPLRFAFNVFGDVGLTGRSPAQGDQRLDFALGAFALLINGQLSRSLLGTAEVKFDSDDENHQTVTLERLHLRWQTRRFYLVGGRTHTDIGYWNTAFHHGAWLHLPIARPRVLRGDDSGGLLPIHWVGVEGGVIFPTASASALTVAAGVGNGRGGDESEITIHRDRNNFKALKLKLEYQGLGLPDLRVGAAGLMDRIAPESEEVRPALPDLEMDEYIANAYAAYRGAQLTLIAEAYSIWHRSDVDTTNTTDAFVVLGYRVGRITPYTLVERTDARGGQDPFYTPVPDMATTSTPVDSTALSLGARVDPSVWSAVKLEYRVIRTDNADELDQSVAVNWSFGI